LHHLAGHLLLLAARAPADEGDQRDAQGQVEKEDRGTELLRVASWMQLRIR
jgi:hypothetical protein